MAFILVISIFPSPITLPIFFSIFYIFMSILFILPPAKILGLLTAYEVAFIILAFHYKTKEVLAYDIFSSLTTWFIALILFFVFLGLHLRESRMRQLLEITSQQDTVSGLANRFAFETYITKTYHTCCNTKQSLAIFMIDIDDFKIYNDTYGHIAGDTCLHTLCGSLKQYADNENFFIARFGGEEIVAVVVDQQVEQLKHYAEGLLTAVRDCGIPASFSSTGKVTISIGVAIATEPQYTLRVSLIEQADHALYEAKRRGKDQYIIYPWL